MGYPTFVSFYYKDLFSRRLKKAFVLIACFIPLLAFVSLLRYGEIPSQNFLIILSPIVGLFLVPLFSLFFSYMRWETEAVFDSSSVFFKSNSIFSNVEEKVPYTKISKFVFHEGDVYFSVLYDGDKWFNSFGASSFKVYFKEKDQLLDLMTFLGSSIQKFDQMLFVQHLNLSQSQVDNIESILNQI